MYNGSEQKLHLEGRCGHRVSSAVWPLDARKGVATGRAAQRRRVWILQGRWLLLLVDALAIRLLFLLALVLLMVTSLLVAILGFNFGYLLLLPLALFAGLFLQPFFLACQGASSPAQPTLETFAGELKSSGGLLSLYAQELKSSPGVFSWKNQSRLLSSLKSQPGLFVLRSNPGLLSGESPVTPMPDHSPLVRVLETYDLRSIPVEHFVTALPDEETGEHTLPHTARAESLEGGARAWPDAESQTRVNGHLPVQDFSRSETEQSGEV